MTAMDSATTNASDMMIADACHEPRPPGQIRRNFEIVSGAAASRAHLVLRHTQSFQAKSKC